MTEQQVRELVVSTARAWLGKNERDGSHREIIDLSNAHKPIARGYAVKYTDAWCYDFPLSLSCCEPLGVGREYHATARRRGFL